MLRALAEHPVERAVGIAPYASAVKRVLEGLVMNAELIELRPGSEALWCQRRAMLRYLLECIHSGVGAAPTALSRRCGDDSSISELDWSFDVLSGENSAERDSGSKIKAESADVCVMMFDEGVSVSVFMKEVLKKEYNFCRRCCTDTDAWNFESQGRFAIRYSLYLLFSVRINVLILKFLQFEIILIFSASKIREFYVQAEGIHMHDEPGI